MSEGNREARSVKQPWVFGGLVSFMGTTPSRALRLSAPAGGTEGFFFDLGEPAVDETSPPSPFRAPESMEDIGRFRKTAQKQGSDIDALALLQRFGAASPPSEQERR